VYLTNNHEKKQKSNGGPSTLAEKSYAMISEASPRWMRHGWPAVIYP